jgi:hypothetical protein
MPISLHELREIGRVLFPYPFNAPQGFRNYFERIGYICILELQANIA